MAFLLSIFFSLVCYWSCTITTPKARVPVRYLALKNPTTWTYNVPHENFIALFEKLSSDPIEARTKWKEEHRWNIYKQLKEDKTWGLSLVASDLERFYSFPKKEGFPKLRSAYFTVIIEKIESNKTKVTVKAGPTGITLLQKEKVFVILAPDYPSNRMLEDFQQLPSNTYEYIFLHDIGKHFGENMPEPILEGEWIEEHVKSLFFGPLKMGK